MKNLKRVLSLALTGVMLVGMMAVGASAVNAEDFTDADEIQHTEAVSIATALKIIDGQDDGSFNPNGLVTRGQMAKMITRARYGGEDPILGVKTTPSFTDIKGRWDESYIEYCYSAGIISGRGDGTFDPDGNVTGTEAAKMLLTALGYDANVYELTGADWAVNVNTWANYNEAKLYAGLKGVDPNTPFTRDQIAQMVYNTLNAKTKELTPSKNTNGVIEWVYTNGDTMLYKHYGAVRVEGIVTDNEYTDNSEAQKGKTTIRVTNGDELDDLMDTSVIRTPDMKVSSGREVFGRAVIIYAKPANTNSKDLAKAEVISEVIVDPDMNTVYTATTGFNGAADKKLSKWMDDKGLKAETDTGDALKYFENYKDVTSAAKFSINTTAATFGDYVAKRGTEVIMIDNDADGKAEYILKNDWVFGQVSKWDEKNEKATVRTSGGGDLAPNNKDMEDVVAYEDIAVDDYVMSTKVSDTWYLTKCAVVEGELNAYENETETYTDIKQYVKSMTVDDETYKTNQVANPYTADGLKDLKDVAKANVLTDDVVVYLDNFGLAVAGDTSAASDYLFVANAALNDVASGLSSATLTAFVYFEDGTSGSYTVKKYTNSSNVTKDSFVKGDSDDDAIKGKVFKYSFDSSDRLILEAALDASNNSLETTVTAGTINYNKELSKLTVNDGSTTTVKYVTISTPVFFVSTKTSGGKQVIDKVRVYNEKTAPSMEYKNTAAADVLWDNTNFVNGVTYVNTEDSARELDAVVFVNDRAVASDWVYLIEYVSTNNDGRVYWAVVDGSVEKIQSNDKTVRTTPGAYGYTMDDDKYDLEDSAYTAKLNIMGEVTYVDSKSIVVKDNAIDKTGVEGRFDSDSVVVYLDGEDSYVDANVQKGDIVCMILDEEEHVEGIFIIEEFDDSSAKIVDTKAGVTKSGSDYIVPLSAMTVQDVKDMFITAGKADVKLTATQPEETVDSKTVNKKWNNTDNNDVADSDLTADKQLYLLVRPDSESDNADTRNYKFYSVKMAADTKVESAPTATGVKGNTAATAVAVTATAPVKEGDINDKDGNLMFDVSDELSNTGSTSVSVVKIEIDGITTSTTMTIEKFSDAAGTTVISGFSPAKSCKADGNGFIYVVVGDNVKSFKITVSGTTTYDGDYWFSYDA